VVGTCVRVARRTTCQSECHGYAIEDGFGSFYHCCCGGGGSGGGDGCKRGVGWRKRVVVGGLEDEGFE